MKELYKALAEFQQSVPVILKDTTGHNYKYADLPAIFAVINPLMAKHGMGFYQAVNGTNLKTVVFHVETGESIESDTEMPFESLVYEEVKKKTSKGEEYTAHVIKGFEGMNRAQAIGSLITYFRRYAISSMLGLVTDKDTDGTGGGAEKTININDDLPF
jgi:hypothetical protein